MCGSAADHLLPVSLCFIFFCWFSPAPVAVERFTYVADRHLGGDGCASARVWLPKIDEISHVLGVLRGQRNIKILRFALF